MYILKVDDFQLIAIRFDEAKKKKKKCGLRL